MKQFTRRRLLQSAGLGLAGLALPGCLRRATSTGTEKDGQGRTVIRFWNGFTGPDGKTMEAMVRRFQKENPDIAVKMQIIPWGTYYDKVTLSLAYGGAPEVFIMHAARLAEFATFDALHPLDDLFSLEAAKGQTTIREDNIAPIPYHASQYQGHHYALPLDVHPIGLYYNTELFEKAGIVGPDGKAKPPTNMTEFLEAAKAITQDTDKDGKPDQWGFNVTNQRMNFITFLSQWGGDILTPDQTQPALTTPNAIAAVQALHDIIYKHKVSPSPEGVDAWLAFRQGNVGMVMEGVYMLSNLEESKTLKFAGAPAPQFGPKQGAWAGSHLLCQPRGITDEASKAAWRLMRYLSDNSIAWARGGQVPARVDVASSPEFKALPVQSAFATQIDYVQYEPLSPHGNALFPFVDPAVEAILLDRQRPEVAFKDAERRMKQILSRPG